MKGFHTTFAFQMLITDLNDNEIKEVQGIDSYIRALARIVEIRQAKIARKKANEITYQNDSIKKDSFNPAGLRVFEA